MIEPLPLVCYQTAADFNDDTPSCLFMEWIVFLGSFQFTWIAYEFNHTSEARE